MSDLRFLRQLGAEFRRIEETHAKVQRSRGRRREWMRTPRFAIAGGGIGLSVLVVVAVVALVFALHPRGRAGSSVPGGGVRLVFSATALNPRSPLGPSLDRAVDILRQRLASDFPGVQVSRTADGLVVVAPKARRADRARIMALAAPAQLEFYDWEANALTPNGKTIASQRQQDPAALKISQGSRAAAPGNPGAGSMNLYDAVTLASQQAPEPSSNNARRGPQYYMFGASGSAACAQAARAQSTTPVAGTHCLLSGPANTQAQLRSGLPSGVSPSEAHTLVVPRGIVVLQAIPARFARPSSISDPTAQFFVLTDHVALLGNDITNPRQSTNKSGQSDVAFGLTSSGQRAFQQVTSHIAHRGRLNSPAGQPLNQHFAIALDTRLITVPSIDSSTYPDGIHANNGADITGGLNVQSAQDLATILRFGPLPVSLTVRDPDR